MSNENTNPASNEQDNNSDPIPPVVNDVNDKPAKEPQSIPKKENTCEIKAHPFNVIIDSPKENKKVEHGIAIFGLLIQLVLACFTYLLFNRTVEANTTSMEALAQAKRANDISERAIILAEHNADADQKTSDANYKISSKSLDAQISSVQQSHKQFEIETRPFMQIVDLTDIVFEKEVQGYIGSCTFKLANLGKLPAYIITCKAKTMFMSNFSDTKDIVDLANKKENFFTYFSNYSLGSIASYSYPIFYKTNYIDNNYYSGIISKDVLLYIVVDVLYKNPITNTKYNFYTIFKVGINGSGIQTITNYDKQIK